MNTWVGFWGFAKTKREGHWVFCVGYIIIYLIFSPPFPTSHFLDHLSKISFYLLHILVRGSVFLLQPLPFHLLSYGSENLISLLEIHFHNFPYISSHFVWSYQGLYLSHLRDPWHIVDSIYPGFLLGTPCLNRCKNHIKFGSGRRVSVQFLVILYYVHV